MILQMNKFGVILGSRSLGFAARNEILNILKQNEQISFDMSGVKIVSNSFADECFGKLLTEMTFDELKNKTNFINSQPFVQDVVISAMRGRMATA